MIKQGTIYFAVVNFINAYKPGETYTSEDFKNALYDMTREKGQHRMWNGQWYRVRTYQTYFRRAGFITNVKRGLWRVEHRVPDFMSLFALETLMGYKDGYYNGREYVKKDPAYNNDLKRRLEEYKAGNNSLEGNLYVRCTKTNSRYYIEGHEYEVLETDSDGYATRIINEYGHPWTLVDPREDTFMNLPYRGKRGDRKKIEPEEPKTDHTAEIKRLGYKPGMKVKLVKTDSMIYKSAAYYIKEANLQVGEIYTITGFSSNRIAEGGEWFFDLENTVYHTPYDCFEPYAEEAEKPRKRMMTCQEAGSYRHLTNGKEYQIVGEEDGYYHVINEKGDEVHMFKWRFAQTEQIPTDRLPQFLEELEILIAKYK